MTAISERARPAPGSRLDVKALIVFFALTTRSVPCRSCSAGSARWRVPPSSLWHGLYNAASGTQAATGLLAALVSTLVMVQGVTLIVLEVRGRRQGRPSVLGPA